MPAFALWDQWYILIPIALAAAAGFIATQALFREMLRLDTPARAARRAARVAVYLSPMWLWVLVFLAVAGAAHLIIYDHQSWTRKWLGALQMTRLAGLGAAAIPILLGTMPLALRLPTKSKRGRLVALLVVWAATAAIAFLFALPNLTFDPGGTPALWPIVEGSEAGLALIFLTASLVFSRTPAAWARAGLLLGVYPLFWAVTYFIAGAAFLWLFGYAAIMFRLLLE